MTDPGAPRVSVLLPVFNGAQYLGDAMRSILAQTYRDFEVVAVDDGSTDDTPSILDRFEKQDRRVRILRLDTNVGAARALNAGLAMVRGEYVARHDADDVSAPGRFAEQTSFLDSHDDVVFVASRYRIIDSQGVVLSSYDALEAPDVLAFLVRFFPVTGVPGVAMFRTAAVRAIGGWDGAFRVAQGWELASRLASVGRLVVLPHHGLDYRSHPAQVTVTQRSHQLDGAVEITRRAISELLGREVSRGDAEASLGTWFASPPAGSAARAAHLFSEALGTPSGRALGVRERARVRAIAAERFVRAALMQGRQGRIVDAAQHFAFALQWHPGGAAAALAKKSIGGVMRSRAAMSP